MWTGSYRTWGRSLPEGSQDPFIRWVVNTGKVGRSDLEVPAIHPV